MRPGEIGLGFDPAQTAEAGVCFIGHIRSDWAKGTAPKNLRAARDTGQSARIELRDGYAPGLTGLSVGQAIQLLYWVDRGQRDPKAMATALRHLPQQKKPSEVIVPGLLDGLDNVNRLAHQLIERPRPWYRQAQQRA